mmetsp:Transcript_74667/g.178122  ORF Transcript_74667/g.178122 Transcript_74667/m.178122 type:complete len:211 (-) Transcript_74667:126-758(-)
MLLPTSGTEKSAFSQDTRRLRSVGLDTNAPSRQSSPEGGRKRNCSHSKSFCSMASAIPGLSGKETPTCLELWSALELLIACAKSSRASRKASSRHLLVWLSPRSPCLSTSSKMRGRHSQKLDALAGGGEGLGAIRGAEHSEKKPRSEGEEASGFVGRPLKCKDSAGRLDRELFWQSTGKSSSSTTSRCPSCPPARPDFRAPRSRMPASSR